MICTTCNGSGCVNIDEGTLSLGWLRCTDCSEPRWSTREHEEIVGGNDVASERVARLAAIDCGHSAMTECCDGCGHFSCPCGVSWDEGAEG